jgi:hypothetical protein
MTDQPFSPRIIFLLAVPLMVTFILSACGGAPAFTEEPSGSVPTDFAPPPTQMVIPTQSPSPTEVPALPAIPEARRLTLEYPLKMKAGVESDIVRLTLEVDDLGNITPTAQFEGNVVIGGVIEIPNLYETHNVTAEARFDIAGITVQPPGSTFQPLKQGESVTFYWSIRPQETGTYRGTIWLHLNFVERVSGEESRMAVSAQIVEIEAVDFFGFSVNFVRTSGVVGSVLGIIVGFPFLDDIVKFLFSRRKKRRKKRQK